MAAKKKVEEKDITKDLLDKIRGVYGQESITTLKENRHMDVKKISSGSLKVDHILGGGLPMGRIVEIYGPESSGKTTLTLHAIAEAMKAYPNKLAIFIDAEHALDPKYAEALGIDLERLLVVQPNSGEEGLNILEAAIRSGDISIAVVDSVDALTPAATIEGDMEDRHIAPLARMMSQALRKLAGAVQKTDTLLIFVNQVREKVGVMYGSPETTTGGRALKFYATQRIRISRVGKPEEISVQARVKCVKNKVARPFLEEDIDIEYGKGVRQLTEIIDMAVMYDVIEKAGAWYKQDGKPLAQGKASFIMLMEEDKEFYEELKKATLNKIREGKKS